MVDLDIAYAKNKTLLLDLKILFKTIPAILSQTKDIKDEGKKPKKKTTLPKAATKERHC
jgi:lipopolysaccharide/colanic/teichoic acid biosynthesis glycosyltransferase